MTVFVYLSGNCLSICLHQEQIFACCSVNIAELLVNIVFSLVGLENWDMMFLQLTCMVWKMGMGHYSFIMGYRILGGTIILKHF